LLNTFLFGKHVWFFVKHVVLVVKTVPSSSNPICSFKEPGTGVWVSGFAVLCWVNGILIINGKPPREAYNFNARVALFCGLLVAASSFGQWRCPFGVIHAVPVPLCLAPRSSSAPCGGGEGPRAALHAQSRSGLRLGGVRIQMEVLS